MRYMVGIICLLLYSDAAFSTNRDSTQAAPSISAQRIHGDILIDGRLTESAWQGTGFRSFIQGDPVEGAQPSEVTEVWVGYDDNAIYVASRMYDSKPESINVRLARRDEFLQTDKFTVYLDGYRDKETGNFFTVTASGVQIDGVLYNDEWDNNNWDGVWESATHLDDRGWSAEIRIPFSQLRFHDSEEQVWGINFRRDISRSNERNYLVYRPRKGSGFVSRFGELVGMRNIHESSGVEVIPYLTTKAQFSPPVVGNPFSDGSDYLPGVGFDMKTTVIGNLSLTATVNPDFGQVEVDPDVVNLSDFESFFPEKRPFFVEGRNIFSSFGRGGANSNWSFNFSSPNFFYTRRIGRSPQGSLPASDYADVPSGTSILGAGKLTGKLGENLTIGTLHAVTNREYAQISLNGDRSRAEVEPYSYYGVARLQQSFDDRRYSVGVLGTIVERFAGDDRLYNDMNRNAYVGGVDGWAFIDEDRQYVFTGWIAGSMVNGTSSRMQSLQHSSSHYYQRPDADHVSVDSSATSLNGYAFRFVLHKQEGSWLFNTAIGGYDPGFNANDAGFSWRTDLLNAHIATGYTWTDPTDWYRRVSLSVVMFTTYNFGGVKTWHGYWSNIRYTLPSYWSFFAGAVYNPPSMSDRSTRGGPLMYQSEGSEIFAGLDSDSRKDLSFDSFFSQWLGGGRFSRQVNVSLNYRPADGVKISFGPGFSVRQSDRQWVTSYDDATADGTFGRRYVFADFDQKTLSATLRLNWIFSPTLSLQLYSQALFSSGSYTNLKSLRRASTDEFLVFGSGGSTIQPDNAVSPSAYTVDADGAGPATNNIISNPDFNRTSLRGNAVLRWQYAPGSTLYLVWTQSRWDNLQESGFTFSKSLDRLALAPVENIFLLKFTYWWNI